MAMKKRWAMGLFLLASLLAACGGQTPGNGDQGEGGGGDQNPTLTFEQLWIHQVGTEDDEYRPALTVSGGKLFLGGTIVKKGDDPLGFWVFDAAGNLQNRFTLQTSEGKDDDLAALAPGPDGRVYALVEETDWDVPASDLALLDFDDQGNFVRLWTRGYGADIFPHGEDLVQGEDGAYYLAGYIEDRSGDERVEEGLLVRYDPTTGKAMERDFSYPGGFFRFRALAPYPGSGVYAGWDWESTAGCGSSVLFVEDINASSLPTVVPKLGLEGGFRITAVAPAPSGDLYVAGWTPCNDWEFTQAKAVVARIKSDGTLVRKKSYDVPGVPDVARALLPLPEGQGLVAAVTTARGSGEATHAETLLVWFDEDGQELATATIGSPGDDVVFDLAFAEGTLYVAGTTDGELVSGEAAGGRDLFLAAFRLSR